MKCRYHNLFNIPAIQLKKNISAKELDDDFDGISTLLKSLQEQVEELKKDKAELEKTVSELKESTRTMQDVS